MKSFDNGDRKYKAVAFSKIGEFEHHLNTAEEEGWKLHSWNFCDNSYSVTYVALMVRDTSNVLIEET
jgi:hypothetical protein